MALLFNYIIKATGWLPWVLVARPVFHFEDRAVQGRTVRGAAIIASNHTDVWDYAAMMFLFPFRILRCVVAELMYKKNAFMTFLLNALGTVRVDRNSHDFSFLGKCNTILEKGGIVEFYPEARLPLPEETGLLPFKPSVTRLALESGAPVIPVYTDGRYFCKGRNHIVIGKPLFLQQFYDESRSEKENLAAITEILRGKIYELRLQIPEEERKNEG